MDENGTLGNLSLYDFSQALASAAPTPGGGGAAALVSALGACLGEMVANLSIGKPKFAPVEQELIAAREALTALRARLLTCMEEDALAFAPLAAAYRIPKGPEREAAIQAALPIAAAAPFAAMETMASAVEPLICLREKGSKLAVSDAACAAAFLWAGLQAESLNVFINTGAMADRDAAAAFNAKTQALLDGALPRLLALFSGVAHQLKGE